MIKFIPILSLFITLNYLVQSQNVDCNKLLIQNQCFSELMILESMEPPIFMKQESTESQKGNIFRKYL